VDPKLSIDLIRLYFGLAMPRGTEWFRDAFGEADGSFSLIDNQREAAVLASGLLSAAIKDDKIYSALAVLTTAAAGYRNPIVRPELLEEADLAIREKALRSRKSATLESRSDKASLDWQSAR
jgi:hypothetical protein